MTRTCQHKGCSATLSHTNRRGLCSHHINTCHADGCEEWIDASSKSGLCATHRASVKRGERIARVCVQCSCKMDRKNKTGICGRCKVINRRKERSMCECGKRLDERNKTGKCFSCMYPGVTRGSGKKHKIIRVAPYTVADLVEAASALTLTPINELNGAKKPQWLARIRFAIWHLAEPHFSYPHIGRMSGDRDHSTIMHGCHRAADLIGTDKGFQILVNEIRSQTLARLANERKAA